MGNLLWLFATMYCLLGADCELHQSIEEPSEQIDVLINQNQSISLGVTKLFELHSHDSILEPYLSFKPTSLFPLRLKMGLVLPDGKTSITDDIRSPISTRYKIIVRLETYLLLFMQPNTVVIVHEAKDSFEIANQYKIPDFDGLGVKMHKINGTKVLAVVPGATCVHLLSDQGVTLFRNGIDNILSLVVLNGLQFLVGSPKGLEQYRLDEATNKVILQANYSPKQCNLTKLEPKGISIVRSYSTSNVFFVLDSSLGILKVIIDLVDKKIHSCSTILARNGCNAFARRTVTNHQLHLVLMCSNSEPYLSEALIATEGDQFTLESSSLFSSHRSPVSNIEMSDDYFLAYDTNTLEIFWNRPFGTESMDYRHQKLDLPGLQTFTIFTTNSRVYMYAIRSFTLVKYELVQEQYSLQAHSDHPILKEIKIEAEIVCSEAAVGGKISTQKGLCIYKKTISLNFHGNVTASKESASLSLGIVTLIFTIICALVCICYRKYEAIERIAKRSLVELTARNKAEPLKFTL